MADCPICKKHVADDENSWLLSEKDSNCTLAHRECVIMLEKYAIEFTDMTCYTCRDSTVCEFSFDPYNTDGDCLAIK